MDENESNKRRRRTRHEVEECIVLSSSWMLQNSYFGLTIGQQITRKVNWQTWAWQPLFTMQLTLSRPSQDKMQMSLDETGQRVELRPTPLRFGGIRWWFQCPECMKRFVKLYKPPDAVFRCRQCHNLTYRSCNRSRQPVAMTGGELMNARIKAANRHWRRKRDRWAGDPDRVTWFNEIFGDRIVVMSSPSQKQSDRTAKGQFAPGNKLGVRFEPGQSGNPGGNHKGTPKITIAYKKILSMSPDEIANFQPQTGAEIMAAEQFVRACNPYAKHTLPYAQAITNRTDGPIVSKVEKVDLNALEAERQRFEYAIDDLVEKQGCSRADAALLLATVEPSFKKFIEGCDNDSL